MRAPLLPESFSKKQGSQYLPSCLAVCKPLILQPHIDLKSAQCSSSGMRLQFALWSEEHLLILGILTVLAIPEQNPPRILSRDQIVWGMVTPTFWCVSWSYSSENLQPFKEMNLFQVTWRNQAAWERRTRSVLCASIRLFTFSTL